MIMKISRIRLIILLLLLTATIGLQARNVQFGINPAVLKPGEKGTITGRLTIPSGMQQIYDINDLSYFNLSAEHPEITFGSAIYPKTWKENAQGDKKYSGSVTLTLPYTVKANARPGKKNIPVLMGYNLCFEDGICEAPEEKTANLVLEIADASGALAGQTSPAGGVVDGDTPVESSDADGSEAAELSDAKTDTQSPMETEAGKEEDSKDLATILKYLLFALLGGFILNITPCVLPILPIRLMSMVNQAQRGQGKVLVHSLAYTIGAMLSFAILASVFIILRSAGEAQGWGFQNQNPYFTATLMSVVFIFALSLLGVFVMSAPGMNTATQASSKGGYSGSFFGGVFAFLMAISCTGPFLGLALPFAFKLPSILLMLFFLIIGLGFALPFIIVGFAPGFLKAIPKPGEWMNIFKEVMGFVLLYIVYTMLKTLYALTGGEYLLSVVFYLVFLGFAVWLYGRFVRSELSKATQWIFTILTIAIIVFAVMKFLPIKEEKQPAKQEQSTWLLSQHPKAPAGWYQFSPALMDSLFTARVPVFLDFGATWCKNCEYNKVRVLHTEKIMQAFKDKGVTMVYGDFTKKDPDILAWIQKYDGAGVPFDRLYIPDKEPIRFNELISDSDIYDALAKLP